MGRRSTNKRTPKSGGRTRKYIGSGKGAHSSEKNVDASIFKSNRISTQPNVDPNYEETGIVYMSESIGIDVVRSTITGFASFLGKKGVDNMFYDKLRDDTLKKLEQMLDKNPDSKICNLRMEFENPFPDLLYHHVYGTLMGRRPKPEAPQNP
jgi:hypothetical protein